MFGIIDENKKFILTDKNRDILHRTALMLVKNQDGIYIPIFTEKTVDESIKEYTDDDIEIAYTGEIYIKGFAPKPDNIYQSKMREMLYTAEIDPLTAHISRLRDENQTEEIALKIAKLIDERREKVSQIKAKFPYFED